MSSSNHHPEVMKAPRNFDEWVEYPKWKDVHRPYYSWYKGPSNAYFKCDCSDFLRGSLCEHLAALMYKWESVHGTFDMTKDEASRERWRKYLEAKAEEERIRHLMATPAKAMLLLSPYLEPEPDGLTFHPNRMIDQSQTNTNMREAEELEKYLAEPLPWPELKIGYDARRNQVLNCSATVGGYKCSMTLLPQDIESVSCQCGRTGVNIFYSGSRNYCAHVMVLFKAVSSRIIRENPGDNTDASANALLALLSGSTQTAWMEKNGNEEQGTVILVPRIIQDKNDDLKLGFDIGRTGGRTYAVKGLQGLVDAVNKKTPYLISKNNSINFAEESFTEDAEKWMRMIASRVRSIQSVNYRLSQGSRYYNVPELSVGSGIPLQESDLDVLYDMVVKEGEIHFQYGARTDVDIISVREMKPKIDVRLEPKMENNKLTGIQMYASMPRLLQGSLYWYVLDIDGFGRVSEEDARHLMLFRQIKGMTGSQLVCVIGKQKYSEFFYRILPTLEKADDIVLKNNVSSIIEQYLPPAPEFTFYIDLNEDAVTCQVKVGYDDQISYLGFDYASVRDADQEQRVINTLRRFFPNTDTDSKQYTAPADEDTVMRIMLEGVSALSAYGEVKGTAAFHRVHIRKAPQPRLSVRIDSGIMDLTIQTKDLSEDELLELLESYRLRKKWYRLRSGDYIDLGDAEELSELDAAVSEMDIDLGQLVHGGVHLPVYRALYVDKLLERHNSLAASRNREFKALIRSFQTIRDSDYEVPEVLSDIIRPYQQYGFRWLCTLANSGFGGILADEMGLGKTVQLLSVLQMKRENGEKRPFLVICPASVVYNWKEESRKFIPDMPVYTLADNLPQRKKMLKAIQEGDGEGLYITSYDLLKRDIQLYDGIQFAVAALDEAQYIKNARTAVAKAVKVLNAEQRYALTGTPIENRLAELWSIFDFLMPGFLYTEREFSERFETPIMKKKDAAATDKLARMTEPFILRRKKADVLTDLPDKLEETQPVQMQEDQRQLYDAQVVHMRELLSGGFQSGEDKLRVLAEITRLRQICCDPSLLFENYTGSSAKREACIERIENAIDGGHRMLVFSQFTSMLSLLEQDLKAKNIPYYLLTGSTPKQERVRLMNEFNSGNVPVFLISLKAGGTGLNLTGADVVIHYDPWWNLAVQNQATDRAHRIGQQREVTVIKLIASETIEEKIAQLQEAKRELADAIITGEGSSIMSLSKEELLALID
ncbi:MAG: DEAD/DEAH box helicase [Clostridia bacterium]|nr:DEAD/DEAH box helicase [Clostridia bacterium]